MGVIGIWSRHNLLPLDGLNVAQVVVVDNTHAAMKDVWRRGRKGKVCNGDCDDERDNNDDDNTTTITTTYYYFYNYCYYYYYYY